MSTGITIEVKGIKQARGGIAFTDREWSETTARRQGCWLVVVGNLDANPTARLSSNPTAASCERPSRSRKPVLSDQTSAPPV